MKFTQRTLAISILALFNLTAFGGLFVPNLLYTGSYSPHIVSEWNDFERHYAISSFSVDFSSFSGYNSFEVSIHILKLETPLTVVYYNGSGPTDLTITENRNISIISSYYMTINSASYSKNSEIILTIDGLTNSSKTHLFDSIFLRFGQSDNFYMNFQNPENTNDFGYKYNIYLFLDIREINGTGNIYVGQDNALGDYYIYSVMEINSTGNFSVSLKTNHHTISLGYTENFIDFNTLTSDHYSKMVWDVQGKYKFEIKSYETFDYGAALLVAYFYLFFILGLDVVVFVVKSIEFLIGQSRRNQFFYLRQPSQSDAMMSMNQSPPIGSPDKYCRNCGAPLQSGNLNFCPSCGKNVH